MAIGKFGVAAEETPAIDEAKQAARQKMAIRLVVVINNTKSLAGSLHFLERRDYQISVVHRISDAVKQIYATKPHAVLVSWNLHNTDVRKAHRILSEQFKMICIVFAEDSTTRTTTSLMGSGIPHSLLAPVSGPSIHMRIQALLRNLQDGARERRRKTGPQYSDKMEGDNGKRVFTDEIKVQVKIEEVPPEAQWKKVANASDGLSYWEAVVQRPGLEYREVYHFKGAAAPVLDSTTMKWGFASKENRPPIYLDKRALSKKGPVYTEDRLREKEYKATEEHSNGDMKSITQVGTPGDGNNFELKITSTEGQEHQATAESEIFDPWEGITDQKTEKELAQYAEELARELESTTSETSPETSGEAPAEGSDVDAGAKVENHGDQNEDHDGNSKTPRDVKISTEESERSSKDSPQYTNGEATDKKPAEYAEGENILYRCAKEALEEFVKPAEFHVRPMLQVNTVGFALISSGRALGYLIGASANGRPTKEFMPTLVNNFWKSMAIKGEENKMPFETVEFQVAPMALVPWAKEQAEFTISRAHKDDTLMLAYVKIDILPHFKDIDSDKIIGVPLEHFSGGSRLLFDIYLHLPKNNKFILYATKGSLLTVKTVTKFLNFGIKELFIRKNEKHLFMAYCACKHLETKKKI